jgi:2-hydroxychromene-2-carboxylate isomerase
MQSRNGSVPIQTAAELAGIDVGQIRRWAAIEGLEIQRRGHEETVVLERVMSLSASARRRGSGSARDGLRARLADARAVENPSVSGLQEIARDRRLER